MAESLRSAGTTFAEDLRAAAGGGREQLRSDAPPPEWEILISSTASQYLRSHPAPAGCTTPGRQAIAGYGVAGCAVTGLDLGYR